MKQIPKYDRTVYVFDKKNCVFRYKYDVDVIDCKSEIADGMQAFLPDDFEYFLNTYINACAPPR